MVAPFPDTPSRVVAAPDGARIAVFSAAPPSDARAAGRVPVVLVHGTTADHRTWRVVGPAMAAWAPLHAIDRRGRGDSSDAPDGRYAIERELDDLAAVCEALAAAASVPAVDVVGHSLGGRIALGASLRTGAIRRIVAYESAPSPGPSPAPSARPGPRDPLLDALRADLARGDHDALLARFMHEGVGMSEPDLAAFRADPIWPLRAAAAPTIVRELDAAGSAEAIGFEALARVVVPVLQLTGTAGDPRFREDAAALHERLADGRLLAIEGAKHAAHHSHPAAFIDAVAAFLGG